MTFLLKLWSNTLAPLLGERRCYACFAPFYRQKEKEELHFCSPCTQLLVRKTAGYCPACGEPAAWEKLPLMLCGNCLITLPPWKSLLYHNEYNGLLRQLLLGLKFKNRLANAKALGHLLAGHPGLCKDTFDFMVPIPLHKQRLAKRGYNQAVELAKHTLMAMRISKRLAPDLLCRERNTPPQRGLNQKERTANIRNAFVASKKVRGQRILLLDDVMTTGATLHSATNTLLDAGATCVTIAIMARTGRHRWNTEFRSL